MAVYGGSIKAKDEFPCFAVYRFCLGDRVEITLVCSLAGSSIFGSLAAWLPFEKMNLTTLGAHFQVVRAFCAKYSVPKESEKC